MLKRYKLKNYNFLLVILLITISTIGVLLIGSAAREYQSRQLIGVITGLILMVVISLIDYSWILNFSWILYVLNLVLLVILKTGFGEENLGATRWLNIGGFQFQPTEIAKIILIIFFAMFLMKHEDDLNTAKTIFKAIGLLLLPLVLVLTQPDLKNTITISVVFCAMMYLAGLSYKVIGGVLAVLVIVGRIVLQEALKDVVIDTENLNSFRLSRILVWLNPEQYSSAGGYQIMQALYAIGSGGFFGKGLGNSVQKLGPVPEAQNDMIFSIVCEELGVFGGLVVLILFGYLLYRLFFIAQNAPDFYGSLVVGGIMIHIALQVILNICVVLNWIPTTGITLPFISYGGTSILFLMLEMGIALSVSRQIKFTE